jgi:hypothetical protein
VDLPLVGRGRLFDRASPTLESIPFQGFGLNEFLVHLPTCLAVNALALRAFCRPCAPCSGPCTTRCYPAQGERGKLAGAGRVRPRERGMRGGHLAGVDVGVFPGASSVPSPDYEADLAPSEDHAAYEGLRRSPRAAARTSARAPAPGGARQYDGVRDKGVTGGTGGQDELTCMGESGKKG